MLAAIFELMVYDLKFIWFLDLCPNKHTPVV